MVEKRTLVPGSCGSWQGNSVWRILWTPAQRPVDSTATSDECKRETEQSMKQKEGTQSLKGRLRNDDSRNKARPRRLGVVIPRAGVLHLVSRPFT